MHKDKECTNYMDGEMNNAVDENDSSDFCEGGSNERTAENGRRLLEYEMLLKKMLLYLV